MTNERLHYEVKLRWNKLNSNHKKDLYPEQLDDALNKAQEDLIEYLYSGNNSKKYRFGFEVTQQRIDMLSSLVKVSSLTPTLITTNQYGLTLPADYKHFLNCITNTCQVPVTIVRINDISAKLRDSNTKPSSKWNRVLGTFRDSRIILYTDGTITSATLEYLKKPRKIFSGGYDTLEFIHGDSTSPSSTSPQQTCELNDTTQELLIDITVQYLGHMFEEPNKIQLQQELINNKL